MRIARAHRNVMGGWGTDRKEAIQDTTLAPKCTRHHRIGLAACRGAAFVVEEICMLYGARNCAV